MAKISKLGKPSFSRYTDKTYKLIFREADSMRQGRITINYVKPRAG